MELKTNTENIGVEFSGVSDSTYIDNSNDLKI